MLNMSEFQPATAAVFAFAAVPVLEDRVTAVTKDICDWTKFVAFGPF